MSEALRQLFSSELFMPRGHSYFWRPGLIWLEVLSNAVIGLAFLAIAAMSARLFHTLRGAGARPAPLLFAAFAVSCLLATGLAHLLDVWVIWDPLYWLNGTLRAVAAIAAAGAAVTLPALVSAAVALAGGARAARERADEAQRSRTRFLALVSHELRTPLSALLLQIDRLRRVPGTFTQQQQQVLDLLDASAHRQAAIVESLLEYAAVQSGRLTASIQLVDLAPLAAAVVEELTPHAEQNGLALGLRVAGDAGAARGDPRYLRLVIVNLVSNAIKFTQQGGVDVEVTRAGEVCRVAVRDTGPGIPPEDQQRVFEPFAQLERADGGARSAGVGLGLALATELARAIGARIELESAPGKGSVFTVVLPAA